MGHAAIDAGVDLILGHGPHILKGIEVYKGKAIFHSLGDFVYCRNPRKPGHLGYWEELSKHHSGRRPEKERKGLIAKCIIWGKKIEKVSFQPLITSKDESHPSEALSREDKRSDAFYEYVEWTCKKVGMDTRFSREGDEAVVVLT